MAYLASNRHGPADSAFNNGGSAPEAPHIQPRPTLSSAPPPPPAHPHRRHSDAYAETSVNSNHCACNITYSKPSLGAIWNWRWVGSWFFYHYLLPDRFALLLEMDGMRWRGGGAERPFFAGLLARGYLGMERPQPEHRPRRFHTYIYMFVDSG